MMKKSPIFLTLHLPQCDGIIYRTMSPNRFLIYILRRYTAAIMELTRSAFSAISTPLSIPNHWGTLAEPAPAHESGNNTQNRIPICNTGNLAVGPG